MPALGLLPSQGARANPPTGYGGDTFRALGLPSAFLPSIEKSRVAQGGRRCLSVLPNWGLFAIDLLTLSPNTQSIHQFLHMGNPISACPPTVPSPNRDATRLLGRHACHPTRAESTSFLAMCTRCRVGHPIRACRTTQRRPAKAENPLRSSKIHRF